MRTRLLAATLTALAAVGVAACSGSGSTGSAATPAVTATAAPTVPPTTSPTAAPATTPATPAPAPGTGEPTADGTPAPPKPAPPSDAGLPPQPDAELTAKVIAALKSVDPAIVGDQPDRAVERARAQCQSMELSPRDVAKQVELAQQRFTTTEHPQGFGPEKAGRIVEVLRATLCPAR